MPNNTHRDITSGLDSLCSSGQLVHSLGTHGPTQRPPHPTSNGCRPYSNLPSPTRGSHTSRPFILAPYSQLSSPSPVAHPRQVSWRVIAKEFTNIFQCTDGVFTSLFASFSGNVTPCTLGCTWNPTTGTTPNRHNLHNKGPYNLAALLPPQLVKRILDLEYVEMSDILPNDTPVPLTGHPPPPPKKPIQDISRWVEKFAMMAAVLTASFPKKAPEMFAYLTSIVQAERNFKGSRWVAYDRCYQREALAGKSLDWSLPNTRLYNEAFTEHAKALPRCTYCLQEDHMVAACPRNPARAWLPWLPDHIAPPPPYQPHPPSQERCNS